MGGTSITGHRATVVRQYNPSGSGTRTSDTVPDTLLGPEGTGNRSFETDAREPCAPGRFGRGQVRGCTARLAGVSTAYDLGPARTLRTAQWTRASSFLCSSY